MKTLMLHEQLMSVNVNDLKKIIDIMNLPENAPWRKDSMESYLTTVGKNPRYWTLYEALGLKVRHTEPVHYPTYRVATWDDLETLWKYKAITNFLSQTHIFDDPGRPATYAIIKNRYETIRNTCVILDFCVWQKQLKKLKALAATAYYDDAHYDTHLDRILWARKLLEPIECLQIKVLGDGVEPINERLDAEDATYAATIDFWRSVIDPTYFSYAGKEVFEVTPKTDGRVHYNYVSMATPTRSNYATFVERTAYETVTIGNKDVTLDTLVATSEVPSLEDEYLRKFNEMADAMRESLLQTTKETYFVTDRKVTHFAADVIPRVVYNVPYPILFLIGLLDMIDVKDNRGANIEAPMISPSLEKYMQASAFLGLQNLSTGVKISELPSSFQKVVKSFMMYSSYNYDAKQSAEYFNQLTTLFKKVFSWMKNHIPARQQLVLTVTRDASLSYETLSACGVRADRPEYDIIVQPTRIIGITGDSYKVSGQNPGIDESNIVHGIFTAATQFFTLTTAFKPYKELQFPRSTKWRGDNVYKHGEFEQVVSDAREALKFEFTPPHKNGTAWLVRTPIFISPEIYYSRDDHLTLMQNSVLRDIKALYRRLEDQEEKKYFRRRFLKIFFEIGALVKRQIGVAQHNSYDTRTSRFHDMLASYGYGVWYYNFVFFADKTQNLDTVAATILTDVDARDFEHWVDTWV